MQCLGSFVYVFLGTLTPNVTFGGLLGQATDQYMVTGLLHVLKYRIDNSLLHNSVFVIIIQILNDIIKLKCRLPVLKEQKHMTGVMRKILLFAFQSPFG